MRKMNLLMLMLMFTILCTPVAYATLIYSEGDGVVYDDISGLSWVRDLSLLAGLDYGDQISGIGALTTAGATDWHMATRTEMDTLWHDTDIPRMMEIAKAFDPSGGDASYDPETGIPSERTSWMGRYDEINTNYSDPWHYMAEMVHRTNDIWARSALGAPCSGDFVFGEHYGAWAVTNSLDPTTPVPEPATMLLFGIGILGLAGVNRRRQ
ncbi:MAG: PEP-CTERM sorting domain-containing protein [Bacteroidetes bacterium]|nr:PEP-CTERM sorting domain-containing protein [Bacteroidota bacterium]